MSTLERFDRLIAIRGDTVKGIPVTAWATNLESYDRDLLLRAAIEATRTLILPEWISKRPDDKRPQDALAAAEAWIAKKSDDTREAAKVAAKACTEAKNETYGHDHRIAEACSAKDLADKSDIWDALVAVAQELLDRIALVSEYQRLPEVRRSIVACLKRVLEPEQPATVAAPTGPVPYAASGTFSVGQQLTHVKFGPLEVVSVNGSAIEVKLTDGSIKKLAHKPK